MSPTHDLARNLYEETARERDRLHHRALRAEARIADLERQLSATRAELAEARTILADFVRETDVWNASIMDILGRPPGYCWKTLERARATVAASEGAGE